MKNGMNKKKSGISKFLLIAAIVVAVMGTALIVSQFIALKESIDNYLATPGNTVTTVMNQIISSSITIVGENIGTYYGIAAVLLGLSILSKKFLVCCMPADAEETDEDIEENVSDEEITNEGDLDVEESEGTISETAEPEEMKSEEEKTEKLDNQ